APTREALGHHPSQCEPQDVAGLGPRRPRRTQQRRRIVNYRTLGKTGLRVSALGFGCGNVGGLMVRGAPAERERAVARALELGINYFATAPSYGQGLSEQNLGLALKALRVTPQVGTKFNLSEDDLRDVPAAVARSLETSLRRLGLDRVDLLQCHE